QPKLVSHLPDREGELHQDDPEQQSPGRYDGASAHPEALEMILIPFFLRSYVDGSMVCDIGRIGGGGLAI
ncbi:MAG: hypothetical protein WCR75_11530, partial [Sphaerochaetaceae bacterium]